MQHSEAGRYLTMKNFARDFPINRGVAWRAIAIPWQGIARPRLILPIMRDASAPRVKESNRVARFIRPIILIVMYLLVTTIEKM